MRRPKPVLERIQANLLVPILGNLTDEVKDSHWIWQGKLPPPSRKKVLTPSRLPIVRDRFLMPPRIRDEDGKTKSVSRILFKAFRGVDLGHSPRRVEGCDYTCVNPFHLKLPPTELPDIEVQETDEDDEIQGLADEIRDFIAAHGRDEHAIRDRYGLDYTPDEITLALRKIQ